MPLYEYHCPPCDLTFEVLTALSEAAKKKPCPECGRRAPRIVSAFAIASGGNGQHDGEIATVAPQPRDPRPLCMKYPPVPLSCHMDEPSLRRFAAHAQGRGNEYDDKTAKQAEVRQQRGIPAPAVAPPAHGHDHHHFRRHGVSQTTGHEPGPAHSHEHGHSHEKGKTKAHAHGAHAH